MPELPDVEGFRRVAENAVGHRVRDVLVHDERTVHGASATELDQQLRGRYLAAPRRHGKWLVVPTAPGPNAPSDPPSLLVHFGMTGMFVWSATDADEHRHDRVVLRFDAGQLRYRDMRKLTGIHLAPGRDDVAEVLDELGPDAATVSRGEYRTRLTRTRRRIKAALMDQSVVAGLGNLCADEILWRARTHPTATTTEISGDGWAVLHRRTRSVLNSSMRAGHLLRRRSWLTGHRDEQDARCPRCSTPLRADTMVGRSTLWCPTCQRA